MELKSPKIINSNPIPEEEMCLTVAVAGPFVLTTFSVLAAFFISSVSRMPVVRWFCWQMGITATLHTCGMILIFMPIMAIDARRVKVERGLRLSDVTLKGSYQNAFAVITEDRFPSYQIGIDYPTEQETMLHIYQTLQANLSYWMPPHPRILEASPLENLILFASLEGLPLLSVNVSGQQLSVLPSNIFYKVRQEWSSTPLGKIAAVSRVGWTVTVVLFAGLALVGIVGYMVYRYRLRSYMDSEILKYGLSWHNICLWTANEISINISKRVLCDVFVVRILRCFFLCKQARTVKQKWLYAMLPLPKWDSSKSRTTEEELYLALLRSRIDLQQINELVLLIIEIVLGQC